MSNGDSPAFRQMMADNGYQDVVLMGDGRYVALHRLMFHWTMIIGQCDDATGYEDRYCYDGHNIAISALAEWYGRKFEGEPIGWHRHPKSGRRREHGNPAREVVAY